jgi:hypothetical protein
VHEDRVEGPIQARRAHVAAQVFALGVEPPRGIEHGVGEVDQRHGEAGLQVQRVVAAAAAELEHLPHRDRGRADDVRREGGLLGVLRRRRGQRPPRREVAVEPRGVWTFRRQNAAGRVPTSAAPPRIMPGNVDLLLRFGP